MILTMANNNSNEGNHFIQQAGRQIADLASNVRTIASKENGMRLLPQLTGPGPYDVICARGKTALNHPGNKRFRAMIDASLTKYSNASSKLEKSLIVSSIVDSVRKASPDGGFIKEDKGQWFEVGDHIAREKCGQSFRDLLHTKYKSSTKAKMRRRKNMQEKMGEQVSQMMRDNQRVATKLERLSAMTVNQDSVSDVKMGRLFNEANIELFQQLNRSGSAGAAAAATAEQQEQQATKPPLFPPQQRPPPQPMNATPTFLPDNPYANETTLPPLPVTSLMPSLTMQLNEEMDMRPPILEERISASIFDTSKDEEEIKPEIFEL